MSKVKLVVTIAVVAALVCWAPAWASAASGWMVNGTQLSGSAKLKQVDPSAGAEIPIPGATVRCEAPTFEVIGGAISSPAGLVSSRILFKGCTSTTKVCQVVGGEVEVGALLGTGITLDGALGARGTLAADGPFAQLEFEGELCALSEIPIEIKGGVDFKAPEGQDERKSQSILWFALSHQLTVGATQIGFHFHGSLLLESEKTWSFL
jgi:hypothetical protein